MRGLRNFLVVMMTLFSIAVFADNKFELQMYDREYGNQFSSRIDLKWEIQAQNPFGAQQLFNARLRRVVLIAKSYDGRSYVQLVLGNFNGDQRYINGQPNTYYDSNPHSFFREDYFVANTSSWGSWMLDVYGPVRIRSIVFLFDGGGFNPPTPPPPQPPNWGSPSFTMNCNSWGSYNRCSIPNGNAVDVRLVQQLSDALHRCRFNDTWGWNAFEIWTDRGCRGIFEVTPRQNWNPNPWPHNPGPNPWPLTNEEPEA